MLASLSTARRTQRDEPSKPGTESPRPKGGLGLGGVGVDGIEGAEGVDEGSAGVHGHGDAEGFGDFLLGGTGFEGGVGVEGDPAIATQGDSDGDEFANFCAEKRGFGVGGGKSLIALEGIRGELGEFGNGFGEFGLIGVPVEEDGFLLWKCRAGVYSKRGVKNEAARGE